MNLPIAVPRKLFKAHWFPAMRRKIKSYVMNYVICLMTSASAQKKASYRLLRLQNPFRIMHTDHFVLLRESHNGVKHILLLIRVCDSLDYFQWNPLQHAKWSSTSQHCSITEILMKSYPIVELRSRRLNFSSRGIKHHMVAIASPWANRMIERINRFLKASLRKLLIPLTGPANSLRYST